MAINPSLLIVPYRYKAAKLYSQLPESGAGDFTVVRGTTATRVNASGLIESVASGVPRLDYTGGGCPSLLVEPAATNLLLRSEEFDNASWIKSLCSITANAATAPNGTMTADRLTPSENLAFFRTNLSLADGVYTHSIFLKADGHNVVQVTLSNVDTLTTNVTTTVNLSSGTFELGPFATAGKVTDFGSGWYRVSVTGNRPSATTRVGIRIVEWTSGSVLAWGAQLETGSVATSYIPTGASTVTRNADVISISSASGLIGQTQGTIYAEVDLRNLNTGVARRILVTSDGTANNLFQINTNTTDSRIQLSVFQSGILQASFTSLLSYVGTTKIAVSYSLNDIVFCINGIQIGVDTSAVIPACSQIDVGNRFGIVQFNDRISAAAIYTSRLSNAELISLTTL